jgi:dipeptidyl aminopeptidase/acylaminoacyl peptidase
MKARIFFSWLLLGCVLSLLPQTASVEISQWLTLGPVEILSSESVLPANESPILDYDFLPLLRLNPEAGMKVQWNLERSLSWRPAALSFTGSNRWQVVFMAVYLETFRWLKAELLLNATFPLKVYLDGEEMKGEQAQGKISLILTLDNGKHLLLLKGALPPGGNVKHTLAAQLKNQTAFGTEPVLISFQSRHRVSMENILNMITITGLWLSPDGRRVTVALNQRQKGETENRSWLEILETENGGRIFSSQGLGIFNNFQWLKDSRAFAFTRKEKDATSIYTYHLDTHAVKAELSGLKDFADYWWAPNSSFLVYATTQQDADKDKVFKYVKRLDDRDQFPPPRYSLTLFFPDSGVRHHLAASDDNFSTVLISPDSRSLLLVAKSEDLQNRPYQQNTLYLFSLADGKREKLVSDPWINDFAWSPDSQKLLLLGGPSAFSGLGSTLPPGVIPNDYDMQAYIFDLKTRQARALTRQFQPSISDVFWHPSGSIFFKVIDQDYSRIYRCSLNEKKFSRLETIEAAVENLSFAQTKNAVYTASGLASPPKLFLLNLDSGKSRFLKDYNRNEFSQVSFGKTENWSFKTKGGKTISGFIAYPPDFNPGRKYPCIVHYYGGTYPIGRNFGGRYPIDWYTANGYIVYSLQPSGSVGFGQEFSALHVNDWGEITSADIIRGVEELLRSHPFIDGRKIGAIGASYGGFMTQILASKTDMFAALISHAGISALSSYWGMGDYGYTYSAVASAASFPWNRKDIYVGHSPLFMAERISKPLLLLHGENDNNVPPGESYQMFAALKLLGKEVALVTFADQQHWILAYPQRVQWMKTIMAWFDRWLKGQGEQWQEMYLQKSP